MDERAYDRLEERVEQAVQLIARLRGEVWRLSGDLAAKSTAPPPAPSPAATDGELSSLREEVSRLRGERGAVLARVRALMREIDQAGR